MRWTNFFTRKDPLFFALRVIVFLPLIALLTITPPFETFVEAPLNHANAWLTYMALKAYGVRADLGGCIIYSPGFTMEVVSGCTGLYTYIFLFVVMASFPASWRMRLKGMLVGSGVIAVLNQLRLFTLFLLGQSYPKLFDDVHVYVWQGVTILVVLLYWYSWARKALLPARAAVEPQPNPAPKQPPQLEQGNQ